MHSIRNFKSTLNTAAKRTAKTCISDSIMPDSFKYLGSLISIIFSHFKRTKTSLDIYNATKIPQYQVDIVKTLSQPARSLMSKWKIILICDIRG